MRAGKHLSNSSGGFTSMSGVHKVTKTQFRILASLLRLSMLHLLCRCLHCPQISICAYCCAVIFVDVALQSCSYEKIYRKQNRNSCRFFCVILIIWSCFNKQAWPHYRGSLFSNAVYTYLDGMTFPLMEQWHAIYPVFILRFGQVVMVLCRTSCTAKELMETPIFQHIWRAPKVFSAVIACWNA